MRAYERKRIHHDSCDINKTQQNDASYLGVVQRAPEISTRDWKRRSQSWDRWAHVLNVFKIWYCRLHDLNSTHSVMIIAVTNVTGVLWYLVPRVFPTTDSRFSLRAARQKHAIDLHSGGVAHAILIHSHQIKSVIGAKDVP